MGIGKVLFPGTDSNGNVVEYLNDDKKPVNNASQAKASPKKGKDGDGNAMTDYRELRVRRDEKKSPKPDLGSMPLDELLDSLDDDEDIVADTTAKPAQKTADQSTAAEKKPADPKPKKASAFSSDDLSEPAFMVSDELKKLNRTLERLMTKVESQDVKLSQLGATVNGLSGSISKLAAPAKPDFTPVLEAIKALEPAPAPDFTPVLEAIKAQPAASASAPDLSPLNDQMVNIREDLKTILGRLSNRPSVGGGTTFEEAVERNLELGEFRKSLVGFTFRRGYSLNGEFKEPAEVAKFFGNADPRSHGLTELVAKFDEKGKFVEWSDELHLRAFELYGSTPKKASKADSKDKKVDSASAPADNP